ncbi:Acyltransferase [Carpediemonas membranifera]|uniref:Acyltransferase n=1 Tax=Carpediemonas membranifera TaxID=201153 RepID=A0A8J6BBS8_9EUKA|nr:Acyltransferase [Carpediemonas membranifera]|eukprot:KAG9396977.1 Acyltransferase [Carpediemonas membranifera]
MSAILSATLSQKTDEVTDLPLSMLNPFTRRYVKHDIFWFIKVLLIPVIWLIHTGCFFTLMLSFAPFYVLLLGKDHTRPMPLWRQRVSHAISLPALTIFLASFGVFVRERGLENIQGRPRVIVSNHVSALDIMAIWRRFQNSFVSKAEVQDIFAMGTYAKCLRCVFVNRGSGNSGIHEVIKTRVEDPRLWPPITFFPEGTTTNGSAVIRFHVGAFKPGVPVQPVAIKYHWRHTDPSDTCIGTWKHLSVIWWSMFTLIEVTYLPLYTPSEEEKADPMLFAENVRMEIAKTLDVPLSSGTFKAKMAFLGAGRKEE